MPIFVALKLRRSPPCFRELETFFLKPASEADSSWLQEFQETRLLDLPIIPASHNSASAERKSWIGMTLGSPWARQQSLPIKDQLMLGVRGIDFRLHVREEGEVQISHGFDTTYSFKRGLEEIKDFLAEHGSEFVILFLRIDWDHRLSDLFSAKARKTRTKLTQILLKSGIELAKVADTTGDVKMILKLVKSIATREEVVGSIASELKNLVSIEFSDPRSYYKSAKHHYSRKGYGIREVFSLLDNLKREDEDVKSIVGEFERILKPTGEVTADKLKGALEMVNQMVDQIRSRMEKKSKDVEALVSIVKALPAKLGIVDASVEDILEKLEGLATVSDQEKSQIIDRITFAINALEQEYVDITKVKVADLAGKVLLYTQIGDYYSTEVIPASDVSVSRIDFHTFQVVDIWQNEFLNDYSFLRNGKDATPLGAYAKINNHMTSRLEAPMHLRGVALDITIKVMPPYFNSGNLNKWFLTRAENDKSWRNRFDTGHPLGILEIDFVDNENMKRIMKLIRDRKSEPQEQENRQAKNDDQSNVVRASSVDEDGESKGEEEKGDLGEAEGSDEINDDEKANSATDEKEQYAEDKGSHKKLVK